MKMLDAVTRRALLFIEKDEAARTILQRALPEYEIEFTVGADDTIRRMHAHPFDGYIIDFWLPDWSGPQLCRAIRRLDPNCPVVFCTAAEAELSRQRATRAGASAYLCKPIDPNALRDCVSGLIAAVDTASLRAKPQMAQAVEDELQRWRLGFAANGRSRNSAVQSVERSARARAEKAFLAAGGTRAHFERWWPHVFDSARANEGVATASSD